MSADDSAQPSTDSIQAYFALAFPNFTYYLQTLSVSIGRRPIPPSADGPQVDVDLGPLKSVSRLHANISFDEGVEAFVFEVIGRNGAWVDGEWVASGSKVTLGPRTKIQIASRTFQFLLAPSPTAPPTVIPPPEAIADGPQSMLGPSPRRSPSVDVVSLSSFNGSPTRSPSPPKPMPSKPAITYATLCYRAIKALDNKASLQEICGWVMQEHEWYRRNSGHGWENSIRHNLSSNQAFVKIKRNAKKEKGKGCFWGFDPAFEHLFEDKDKPGTGPKHSTSKQTLDSNQAGVVPDGAVVPGKKKLASKKQQTTPTSAVPSAPPFKPPLALPSSSSGAPAKPQVPVTVCLPLRVAKLPEPVASTSTSVGGTASLNPPPIVLHNGELFLNPEIFSHLTRERLEELRLLGAQPALEILQGEIVKFLKEKMKAEALAAAKLKANRMPPGGSGGGAANSSTNGTGGSSPNKARPINKVKPRADVPLGSPLTTKPLVPAQVRQAAAAAAAASANGATRHHPPAALPGEGPAVKKRRIDPTASRPGGPSVNDSSTLSVSIGV